MSFLIPDALANTAASGAPASSGMSSLLILVVFFAAFYFFIIRPQNKRQKEMRAMINSVAKGDEIITNGGLAGKIAELNDTFIELEIADGVKVKIQRGAIASTLPKGTLKSV
jgi:preprotein translocase subunit YajC